METGSESELRIAYAGSAFRGRVGMCDGITVRSDVSVSRRVATFGEDEVLSIAGDIARAKAGLLVEGRRCESMELLQRAHDALMAGLGV